MTLAEIKSSLRVENNNLVLKKNDLDIPELNSFLEKLPDATLEMVTVTIDLQDDKSPKQLTLSGEFGGNWDITGIDDPFYSFSNTSLTIRDNGGNTFAVDFTVEGSLKIGNADIPVSAGFNGNDMLRVKPDLGKLPAAKLPDLFSFGAGQSMPSFLPTDIEALNTFAFKKFELEFGLKDKKKTRFSVELEGALGWKIIPEPVEIVIENMLAGLDITHSAFEDHEPGSSFSAAIGGTIGIKVGGLTEDFRIVLHLNPFGDWTLEIDTRDEKGFPPIEAMTALIGGQELTKTVSGILKALNLNEFTLTKVEIGLDIFAPGITYIKIGSKLAIGGIEIDTNMMLPKFALSGSLASYSSKPGPVVAINAATFLKNMKLPPHDLPEFAINTVVFDVEPVDSTYSIDIDMSGHWRYDDILNLEDLSLTLGYSKGDVSCEVVGALKLFEQLVIVLSAKHPGKDEGWQFEGRTAEKVNLSEVVQKILRIELPEGVPDVVIDNLDISINTKKQFLVKGKVSLGAGGREDSPAAVLPENKNKKLQLGDKSIDIGSLEFHFTNTESHITITGRNIPAIEGIDIELKEFTFSFNYIGNKTQKEWDLGGTIKGRIFDHDGLTLNASYKNIKVKDTVKNCFALTYEDKSKKPAIDIPDLIRLEAAKIDLGIERKQAGRQTSADWHVLADGGLQIRDLLNGGRTLLEINGELSLDHTQNVTKLVFAPVPDSTAKQGATLSLPLPVYPQGGQGDNPSLDYTFEKIEIACKTLEDKKKFWEFVAASSLTFSGVPGKLNEMIHSSAIKISSYLKINNDGIDFLLSDSISTAEFDYPDIPLPEIDNSIVPGTGDHDGPVHLGKGAIGINDLHFRLTKDDIQMSLAVKVGLPSELNRLFARALRRGDEFELLNVYNPDPAFRDSSTIDLQLGFGFKTGLLAVLATSPFKFISIENKRVYDEHGDVKKDDKGNIEHIDDSKKYIYVELEKAGAIGEIEFEVPSFSIDTSKGALAAKGGFEIIRDIEIPLDLLKHLLKQNNIPDRLPDTIPLKGIEFFDEKGRFEIDKFITEFRNIAGIDLPDEVKTLFRFIVEKTFDKLPDRLKPYLNLTFPKGFHFDIAVTPDGGCKINVQGHGDKKADGEEGDVEPMRLLYPAMAGYLPMLYGIEFRSFSFGELLSGAFFLVEVDMRIDQFDVLSMIIALLVSDLAELDPKDLDALQEGGKEQLRGKLTPQQEEIIDTLLTVSDAVLKAFISIAKYAKTMMADPRALQTTLIIEKLFMPIIYETEIPIPVPLFYDRLGVEVTNILDFTVQSHISFPAPSFNLMEIVKTAFNFKKFITDGRYELPVEGEGVPEHFDLKFKADNNYFELPELLGGNILLGAKGTNFDISLYKTVANILNALKKISLDKIIRAIPYKDRIGEQEFVFGPLSMGALYFLTTSDEIRAQEYLKDRDYLAVEKKPDIDERYDAIVQFAIKKVQDLSGSGETVGPGDDYSVVFLSGHFGMERLLGIDAKFGLLTTSAHEFMTGFQFSGHCFDFIELDMKAAAFLLKGSKHDGLGSAAFQISGETALTISSVTVFRADGLIRIDGDSFHMEGDIKAFPASFPVHADCRGTLELHRDGGFLLSFDSEAHLQLIGFDLAKTERSIYMDLGEQGVCFHARVQEDLGALHTLFDCDFEIEKAGARGTAAGKITLGSLRIIDDSLSLSLDDTELVFSGDINLLPDIKSTHFRGNLAGRVSKERGINITGRMDVQIAGLAISSCDLNMQNDRIHFQANFLGSSTRFDLAHQNNVTTLTAQAKLPLLSIRTGTTLSKTLSKTHFDSDFAGLMKLSCDFQATSFPPAAKGDIRLTMLSIPVFTGNISINRTEYTITGDLNVFPPGSPLKFNIHSQGKLNHEGIRISGSDHVGIHGLLTLYSEASIFNGLPAIASRVNVLGLKLGSRSGLYPYRKAVAFCLRYTIPRILFVPPVTWYVMVSPFGLYGPSPVRPRDWPGIANEAPITEAEAEVSPIEDVKMPDSRQSIEHIGTLLKSEINALADENRKELLVTISLYHVEIKTLQEAVQLKRVVNIHKTDYLSQVEDNIFSLFDKKSAETEKIDELEFQLSQGQTQIIAKSRNAELNRYQIRYQDDLYDAFVKQFIDKL